MNDLLKLFGIDPDTFSMKKGFAIAIFTGLIFSIIGALSIDNSSALWGFAGILFCFLIGVLFHIFEDEYNIEITKKEKVKNRLRNSYKQRTF